MGSLEARRVAEGDRAGSIILHALVISFKPFRCSPMFGGGRATQKQAPREPPDAGHSVFGDLYGRGVL